MLASKRKPAPVRAPKMKRFRLTYRDCGPDDGERFTCTVRAHDEEHAEMKFFDDEMAEGFVIETITEVRS